MARSGQFWFGLGLGLSLSACGNPLPGEDKPAPEKQQAVAPAAKATDEAGEAVKPPFAVRGELEGLFLVWFDEQGLHTAKQRSEVPEAHRARVRVEALNLAPGKRLDPDHVYVADIRNPAADGAYSVRTHTRAWFDNQVDGARAAQEAAVAQAAIASGVTIYKASWCGACKAAARYLRSRNVNFVEKDIEQDQAAAAEMQRKAAAAGKRPSGVPVIDFRGQIILGFDEATLERLIASSKPI